MNQNDKYINQKYNFLTVIKYVDRDKSNKKRYLCKCDCGNEKVIRISDITSNKIVSCGCFKKQKSIENLQQIRAKRQSEGKLYYKDLTGLQVGRLTVLGFDLEVTLEKRAALGNKDSYWLCSCNCGNEITVRGAASSYGSTQSCGCLLKETSRFNMLTYAQPLGAKSRFLDLTNQQFGKLTVLSRAQDNKNRANWICQCECGNSIVVSGHDLTSGHTQSCGCLGNSLGQNKIRQILLDNNISFVQEVKFADLKDKSYLRFDFGLLDENGQIIKLIEYDGRQHSDPTSIWYTEEVIKHDQMKTNYCEVHKIPLLRISYQDYELIDLAMLLS